MHALFLSLVGLLAGGTWAAGELSLDSSRVVAVYSGKLTFEKDSVVLKSRSVEYSSGLRLLPPPGKTTFDLSSGRYLAADLESLADHQQRIGVQIKSAEGDAWGTIALDPGEKATLKLQLPHAHIYSAPAGAKGVKTLDTTAITNISFSVAWPYEGQFSGLLNMRLSNVRLMGTPDYARKVTPANYLPFVDKFGQFAHVNWLYKVHDASELRDDLRQELSDLKTAPDAWDEYGGWKNGPQLEATGHFRAEKVDDTRHKG